MRCPACDAPALTDDARFCVGCGAELPEPDHGSGEDPPPQRASILPRTPRARRRVVREKAPTNDSPWSASSEPTVPMSVVIGGAVVLLVILLLILLAG